MQGLVRGPFVKIVVFVGCHRPASIELSHIVRVQYSCRTGSPDNTWLTGTAYKPACQFHRGPKAHCWKRWTAAEVRRLMCDGRDAIYAHLGQRRGPSHCRCRVASQGKRPGDDNGYDAPRDSVLAQRDTLF